MIFHIAFTTAAYNSINACIRPRARYCVQITDLMQALSIPVSVGQGIYSTLEGIALSGRCLNGAEFKRAR